MQTSGNIQLIDMVLESFSVLSFFVHLISLNIWYRVYIVLFLTIFGFLEGQNNGSQFRMGSAGFQ